MAWRILHFKRLERGGTKEETERKQPGRKKPNQNTVVSRRPKKKEFE